jgi:hypothetical protein
VAKGFSQIEGVDFHNTFVLVAQMPSACNLIAYCIFCRWHLLQIDVKLAYLNALLDEENYVSQLEGFVTPG